MTLSESQNLILIFNFWSHISTFRAQKTPKSGPYVAKNNNKRTSEQLTNNFQKVQKINFLDPKMVQKSQSES